MHDRVIRDDINRCQVDAGALALLATPGSVISEERLLHHVPIIPDGEPPRANPLRVRAPAPSNVYPIVSATEPAQPTSMPLHQDGTDYSYFSPVKFGTSDREYYLLVDTGSADTWVMGADCTSEACGMHNTFGPDDSTTLVESDRSWNITYGTGSVSGNLVNDTITLAGMTIPLTFRLANVVSDDFKSYPMDGILGLGRPMPDEQGVRTVMEVLESERKLKANLYGINLQRSSDATNDGVVNFGDWDRSKVDGDLAWITTRSESGVWEIAVDDTAVDDTSVGFTGKSAIIDSGTSFILMPPEDAKKLHESFPDSRQTREVFEVPCSATAELRFSFAGIQVNVSAKDYVGPETTGDFCSSNIIGRQLFGPDQWLLGDAFMKNVYSVFDFDQSRIGTVNARNVAFPIRADILSLGFGRKKLPDTTTSSTDGANSTTASPTRNATGSSSTRATSTSSNDSGSFTETPAPLTGSSGETSSPPSASPTTSVGIGSPAVKINLPMTAIIALIMTAVAYYM